MYSCVCNTSAVESGGWYEKGSKQETVDLDNPKQGPHERGCWFLAVCITSHVIYRRLDIEHPFERIFAKLGTCLENCECRKGFDNSLPRFDTLYFWGTTSIFRNNVLPSFSAYSFQNTLETEAVCFFEMSVVCMSYCLGLGSSYFH